MAARAGGGGAQVMVQPINLIFKFLQTKTRVRVWLYDEPNLYVQGVIVGFDEYMNLVLSDAEQVRVDAAGKSGEDAKSKQLGTTLLKGDAITLIMPAS
ncbi:Small nuclear ribonucleoprotein E [Porphyridium purpureum]|uniref:Small nuclear ribonucleoprotein E n=1 Tax=Porphyridium purpureum TaxID=35688 RepID=A0A5J4YMD9_PORPP|nr:Small nuclear ribonucleoprotein E [Porphyridium purpureum]|eukprot:POR8792..scf295_9